MMTITVTNLLSDKRKKRSPFRRQKNAQPTFIRDTDRDILRWVYQCRLLTTDQVSALTGRSSNYLAKRLARLYDTHHLDRLFIPLTHGRATILHILGKRGKEELVKEGIEGFGSIPKKDASGFFMEHAMELNDVFVILYQACQGEGYTITTWIGEYQFKTDYDHVAVSGYGRQLPVQPDAFFTIQTPEGRSHFFLEIDRGTMESKRFKTKVAAYTGYYHGGGYTRRFGHKGFRVLTVVTTKTNKRVNTLLQASEKVERIGKRFWFAHKPDLAPENILTGGVWRIAGSGGRGVIFK